MNLIFRLSRLIRGRINGCEWNPGKGVLGLFRLLNMWPGYVDFLPPGYRKYLWVSPEFWVSLNFQHNL